MANGLDITTITSVLSVTTFIIGILLGVIIKRAIKLALGIVALVALLAVTGYLNLAWSMPSGGRDRTLERLTLSTNKPRR